MNARDDKASDNSELTQATVTGYRPAVVIAGRYKLLEQIGEGGMGTVWVAEQTEPLRRRVAIKLIKPGMDSRQVVSRFEAERQALALMDHPNIAKIYDGGVTAEGRPFFVMEYVKGIPITEYCDKARLPIPERLKLLMPVCQAVQHAHQKGVIHRDLKPSNILVCLYDGQPIPKVIDFGLAKAMHQPLTEHTLYTGHGLAVGTPMYMSPEQAEFNNLDIDTRTDIYSLGVILYELLTGTTPLERQRFKEAAWQEVLRLIQEDEPPKPSTRLSCSVNLAAVAAERNVEPAQLSRLIKGDLDWIAMKTLEKERSRRYDTPNSLCQDLERYLRQETVLARPPSAAYRLQKLFQRNRAAAATAGAVGLALLLGTIVSTFLAIHATQQRKLAETNLAEATLQRQAAQSAKASAEQDRDKAKKASAAEQQQRQVAEEQKRLAEEQRLLADQQRQTAETARLAEAAERKTAERERDRAQALNEALNQQKEHQRRSLYTAQMTLIQKAWDAENINRVRELLNSTRPRPDETDLRGFEWHYWQRLSHSEVKTLKVAAAGAVTVVFSRDGQQFAAVQSHYQSGTAHHEIHVWETATGKELLSKPLPFDEGAFGRMVGSTFVQAKFYREYRFSYLDAERVAVVTADRPNNYDSSVSPQEIVEKMQVTRQTVRLNVYRLDSGEEAFALATTAPLFASHAAESFVVNGDGSRVVELDSRQRARLRDGRTGELLTDHSLPVTAESSAIPSISDDSKMLAVLGTVPQATGETIPLVRIPLLGQLGLPIPTEIGQIPNRSGVAICKIGEEGAKSITIPQSASANQLTFSLDGTRLAGLVAGAGQNTARIWNTKTGEEICRITDPTTPSSSIIRLVFSPDGRWLATSSRHRQQDGKSVRLWDTATGRPGPEFKGQMHAVTQIAFSSDGDTLLSSDKAGTIKTWQVPPAKISGTRFVFLLKAQSPDGNLVAVQKYSLLGSSSAITLEDLASRTESRTLPLPQAPSFVLFSSDGKHLLTANLDPTAALTKAGTVRLWDTATGKEHTSIVLPAYESTSRRGAPNDTRSLPISAEGTAFSPDGRLLAMILSLRDEKTPRKAIRIWNVADGREICTTATLSADSRSLRFSPDGKLLVSGQTDSIHPAATSYILIGSNRNYSTNGSFSGIEVWDAASGSLRLKESATVSRVGFSPQGGRVIALTHGSPGSALPTTAVIWDDQTGEVLARIPQDFGRAYQGVAISHDHRRLAVIGGTMGISSEATRSPGEVWIYDSETGEKLVSLQGHNGPVASAVFSLDGQRIATSAGVPSRSSSSYIDTGRQSNLDGETKVWDAATGQELLTLLGSSESLAFSTTSLGSDPAMYSSRSLLGPTWDASPISAQVESEELIESLLATSNSTQLIPRGELLERIRRDPSLRDEVRRGALELARNIRRNPATLNEAAWAIAKSPEGSRDDNLRALDYAQEASDLAPQHALYLNTLGVAHYRLGQYPEALTALERCLNVRQADKQPNIAEDLLFLAMTHYQLGHVQESRDYFRRGDRTAFSSSANTKVLDAAAALLKIEAASPLVDSGNNARQKREYDKALEDYAAALRVDPQHATAFYNRGYLWSERRVYDKAIADFNEAVRIDPAYAWAIAHRGYAWREKGELDKALIDFGEALRLSPRYHWALARRGGAFYTKGDSEAALRDYDLAIQIDARTTWYFTGRAQVWRRKGDLDKAIQDYGEALRLEPKNISAYANRADLWRQKGELEKALVDYDEALKLNPKDAGYLNGRANIWKQKQDYNKALADYDQAVALDPKNAVFRSNRGRLWEQKKDYDKAIEDHTEAIRLNPNRALSYGYRGDLWKQKGDIDRAISDYDEAIRLDPKYVTAYANRAEQWRQKGNLENVLRDYNEAIRLNPKSAIYYNERGRAWRQKGEYDNAIQDYDEALRIAPNNATYHNNRGFAWEKKGDLDKALLDYSASLSANPNYETAYLNRARTWKEKGNYANALSDYEAVIRQNPKNANSFGSYAFLLATCPDEKFRDGKRAVECATTACELTSWKNATHLDTLAAAHAEAGDFEKAVQSQKQALELATDSNRARFLSRLKLYKAGQPYREQRIQTSN